MAKKAAAKGRADLPVSQDAQQRVPTTKKDDSLVPSDGEKEILDEKIAGKLV
jgi:hypothetical protein